MKKNSKFTNLIYILIAGMGNVKQGNWPGILIYFFVVILLGSVLIFVERNFIEQFYRPSQTACTFALLIYIAFAFFWNGTKIFGYEGKNHFFDHDEVSPRKRSKS